MTVQNDELKKLKDRMDRIDEKQKQLSAQKRAIRSRFAQKERKARTKRLIEKGAVLEKFQGEGADKISADDSLIALKRLQKHLHRVRNDFESLKAFTNEVKYQKKNPDDPTEPTRTVYSNWQEQQNHN